MSLTKTLDDAHREADCAVVCAQWYKELLLKINAAADTTEADQLIADAQQRIADLTAQQAPPGDVVTARNAFFQAHRDDLADGESRLDTIANDAILGPLLYPSDDPATSLAALAVTQKQIAALDLVWSP